jgi:integrase
MPVLRLTKRAIESLPLPERSTGTEYRDDIVPGLLLRVFPSGAKVFSVDYSVGGGRRRCLRLKLRWTDSEGVEQTIVRGRYHEDVDLEEVRREARRLKYEAETGKDPAAKDRAKRGGAIDTVSALCRSYLDLYSAREHSPKWSAQVARLVETAIEPEVGGILLSQVRRGDLIVAIERAAEHGGEHHVHQVKRVISAIFAWAADRELVDANPAVRLPPRKSPPSRDRVLSDDELLEVWEALEADGSLHALSALLVLFTAQRGGEVRRMRWADVSADGWWRIPDTKADREQWAFLGPLGSEVLTYLRVQRDGGEYCFPSSSGARSPFISDTFTGPMGRIRKAAGVEDWRIHDLRRTAASGMAALGVREEVLRRVLNHSTADGSALPVYVRHSYRDDVQRAVETWHRQLAGLRDGRVVEVAHFG